MPTSESTPTLSVILILHQNAEQPLRPLCGSERMRRFRVISWDYSIERPRLLTLRSALQQTSKAPCRHPVREQYLCPEHINPCSLGRLRGFRPDTPRPLPMPVSPACSAVSHSCANNIGHVRIYTFAPRKAQKNIRQDRCWPC